MASSITVPVSSLYHLVAQMSNDKMNYVSLMILDEEEDEDGKMMPPSLALSAYKSSDPDFETDYGEIEAVE